MRKITVLSMITLDGVMQAPGGSKEDEAEGFRYGGWTAPYNDEASGAIFQKLMQPADYLLGRKTFQIWENYWPTHGDFWPSINTGTKYVLSNTISQTDWKHTEFLKGVEDIKKLKASDGADLQVWGSSKLIQLLLKNDLVDELWLITFPITLGEGKKLFADGEIAAAFTLAEGTITPSGVILANYKRDGDVKTGEVEV
ncbi:MAG TPA: dihydrofolate reductase family protein [Candidatus Kapabacteria bacterium]|nr:dihydrofolate reductase family protein [Candidatus Kapabacteria bacterium]